MSKKRNNSLNSKSKLNKELKDYQQHKQSKKGLGYIEEDEVKHSSKKKKKKTKKADHKHKYEYKSEEEFGFGLKCVTKEYKCKHCDKKIHKITTL